MFDSNSPYSGEDDSLAAKNSELKSENRALQDKLNVAEERLATMMRDSERVVALANDTRLSVSQMLHRQCFFESLLYDPGVITGSMTDQLTLGQHCILHIMPMGHLLFRENHF